MSDSTLRVIKPLPILPSMLLDASVPEDDHAEYSAGTSYAKGVRVMVLASHDIWESVVGGNVGNTPGSDKTKWLRVGATNRWKAFDKAINSQVTQSGSITYRLKPGKAITSVNALNVKGATSMRVRVVDAAFGVLANEKKQLRRKSVKNGWWSFWFGEKQAPTQALFISLPGLPSAEIEITIEGGSDLAVGVLLLGTSRTFSMGVKMGARVGIQDFSQKERSQFGDLELVEGNYADRAGFSMLLRAGEVDAFKRFLTEVRATPCLWIGSRKYESTTIYGSFKSFEILINYFDYSDAELDLESLI
jgi:hypothetical protein